MYRFFTPTMTRDEIKQAYRNLAKRYHPDMGGDTATMQQLNAEYTAAMDTATRREMPGRSEASYTHQAATNETIRAKMEEALKVAQQFPFLEVEICGYWLWIHGTSKRGTSPENDAALDALRAAGYRFAHQKKLWYFATIPSRSRRESDMDEIRASHGSTFAQRADRRNRYNSEPGNDNDYAPDADLPAW